MSAGNMERVLRLMSEKGASDVYLSASSPILIKINGQLLQLSDQPLTHAQPRQLVALVLQAAHGQPQPPREIGQREPEMRPRQEQRSGCAADGQGVRPPTGVQAQPARRREFRH